MLLFDTAHFQIRKAAAADTTMARTHAMTRYPALASFSPSTTSFGLLSLPMKQLPVTKSATPQAKNTRSSLTPLPNDQFCGASLACLPC